MITPAFPSFSIACFAPFGKIKRIFPVRRVILRGKGCDAGGHDAQGVSGVCEADAEEVPAGKGYALAFVIGGPICVVGQASETASGGRG